VSALLSENGFSLDELVIKTKELFDREGMAGFVGLLLELIDAYLCWKLVHKTGSWQPDPCCDHPAYELDQRIDRRLRTSVGTVHIRWRRLRCTHCGRSFLPLREFLGLARYQSKSRELERIVTEVVAEQNYRRTSRHLALIGMIPVPKSTAHRWVARSDCDELPTPDKTLQGLLVDGTGYKRRPDARAGINNRGELRVALGIQPDGRILPLGTWSGKSWEEIGHALTPAAETKPVAEVLISDGEQGLAEGLAELINSHQRCHWHQTHDLGYFMWRDGAPLAVRREMQHQLSGIIGIELPEQDFQAVSAADKASLEQTTVAAEQKLNDLVSELIGKGYHQAASYIRNAKEKLFTYVRFWLKYGLVTPRVSSLIERMMREIGRRLKRIAFGWSESGAAKMARIIIKRFTNAGEWDAYWAKQLRITGQVRLVYNGVQAT
jgi:hypothetical protein